MTDQERDAIKSLSEQGWTRKKIWEVLDVTYKEIQEVLGKSNRGRKPKKKTENKDVSIVDVIAIDQSASMDYVSEETAEGVNQYIKDAQAKVKETGVKTYLGVVVFGTSSPGVKTLVKITDVESLEANIKSGSYGMTPLNDGLLKSIELAEKFKIPSGTKDVTITVFTDGHENASRHTMVQTAKKVKQVRELEWTIAFVGPIGAESYAKSLNIDTSNVLEYDTSDAKNFSKAYSKMSSARSAKSDDISLGKFSSLSYFAD